MLRNYKHAIRHNSRQQQPQQGLVWSLSSYFHPHRSHVMTITLVVVADEVDVVEPDACALDELASRDDQDLVEGLAWADAEDVDRGNTIAKREGNAEVKRLVILVLSDGDEKVALARKCVSGVGEEDVVCGLALGGGQELVADVGKGELRSGGVEEDRVITSLWVGRGDEDVGGNIGVEVVTEGQEVLSEFCIVRYEGGVADGWEELSDRISEDVADVDVVWSWHDWYSGGSSRGRGRSGGRGGSSCCCCWDGGGPHCGWVVRLGWVTWLVTWSVLGALVRWLLRLVLWLWCLVSWLLGLVLWLLGLVVRLLSLVAWGAIAAIATCGDDSGAEIV